MKGSGSFSKLFTISPSGYPEDSFAKLDKDVQSSDQWPAAVFPLAFRPPRGPQHKSHPWSSQISCWTPRVSASPLMPCLCPRGSPLLGSLLLQLLCSPHPFLPGSHWPATNLCKNQVFLFSKLRAFWVWTAKELNSGSWVMGRGVSGMYHRQGASGPTYRYPLAVGSLATGRFWTLSMTLSCPSLRGLLPLQVNSLITYNMSCLELGLDQDSNTRHPQNGAGGWGATLHGIIILFAKWKVLRLFLISNHEKWPWT